MDKERIHRDINRSHHLGDQKAEKNKQWLIIINFCICNIIVKVFKHKGKLKGKGISVTESLTKARIEQLQKPTEEHSFWYVWSNGGKILYIDANDHNRVKAFYS